jgi:hypothetical protein
MSKEFECGFDNCSSNYKNVSSLRVHQRKKHAREFLFAGAKVRQRARMKEVAKEEPKEKEDMDGDVHQDANYNEAEQQNEDHGEVEEIEEDDRRHKDAQRNQDEDYRMSSNADGQQTDQHFSKELKRLRSSFDQRIHEVREHMESQQRQFSVELNGLMTEVIDQREHLRKLSKKDTKWCVVCFEKEIEYAFQPCGHKCACKSCAMMTLQKFGRCPCCRTKCTDVIRIYDVSSAWNET